jgi:hypothetical protein
VHFRAGSALLRTIKPLRDAHQWGRKMWQCEGCAVRRLRAAQVSMSESGEGAKVWLWRCFGQTLHFDMRTSIGVPHHGTSRPVPRRVCALARTGLPSSRGGCWHILRDAGTRLARCRLPAQDGLDTTRQANNRRRLWKQGRHAPQSEGRSVVMPRPPVGGGAWRGGLTALASATPAS